MLFHASVRWFILLPLRDSAMMKEQSVNIRHYYALATPRHVMFRLLRRYASLREDAATIIAFIIDAVIRR